MERGDGRLRLVFAESIPDQRRLQNCDSLGDQYCVPTGSVLFRQRDQLDLPGRYETRGGRDATASGRVGPATSGSSVKVASCRVRRIASAARSTSPPYPSLKTR